MRQRRFLPYFFAAPAAVYIGFFMLYPLAEGARLSFTDTTLLAPRAGEFVGLDNYTDLIASASFWKTIRVTAIYTAASVAGAVGLGLIAALGMNRMIGRMRFLRAIVIIPWAVPIIPVALITAWILDSQYGVLNWTLMAVDAIDSPVRWLDNKSTALPAILVATIWRIFPFSAIVLLAALQSVRDDLYEAARIDGAGGLNRFKNVTLPSIAPTLAVLCVFVTIWSLRRFELIWVLTEGGPLGSTTTIVIELYRQAFQFSDLGHGSAIGMVGFLIAAVLTVVYLMWQSRRAKYER